MRVLPLALLAGARLLAAVPHDCAIGGVTVNATGGAVVPRAVVNLVTSQDGVSTKADENGRWRFDSIACGRISVYASHAGFVQNSNARSAETLLSGSPREDYRLELTPQAVLVGRVVDETGDAQMNVTVQALKLNVADGRRVYQAIASANTNDEGDFRLAGLAQGRYVFCAAPHAGLPDATGAFPMPSCFPSLPDPGSASALTLSAGSQVRQDFTVRYGSVVHVRGHVAGIPPGLRPAAALMSSPGSSFFQHRPVTVMPNGDFEAAGVSPGEYLLTADAGNTAERWYADTRVSVGHSDVENVSIRMEPVFTVPVEIRNEGTKAGKPGGTFQLTVRGADAALGNARMARFDLSGSPGELRGVARGRYTVQALAPQPYYVKSAVCGAGDLLAGPVEIGPGTRIQIVISDDAGLVEGDVAGTDDKPAAGSHVTLVAGTRALTATADSNGHFRIGGVAPGEYSAYAWTDPEAAYAEPDWLRNYRAVRVTVEAGQTAPVRLAEQTPDL